MNSIKSTLTRNTTMLGRKGNSFSARLTFADQDSGWLVMGTNKEALTGQLFDAIKNASEYSHARRYVRKGSVTFALYYANGWCYDIVRDDGKASSCFLNVSDTKTYPQALEKMLAHVEQHDGF